MDITAPDEQNQTEQTNRGMQWWVWVLIAIFTCCGLLCAGTIGVLYYFGREPENFSADYALPSLVKKGENFDLSITMINSGDQPVTVTEIYLDESLGDSILDGAIVLNSEPQMERDYSTSGLKIFIYDQTIQPGESKTAIFHLQATTVGEFGGSVRIYVGDLSIYFPYIGIVIQE